MAYNEHDFIKPERMAETAATAIDESLVLAALMRQEGLDQFKGAKDDTINIKVEGVLPFRTYGWRNARTAPVVFDDYAERKIAISFGGDLYSGVRLTDEQALMDTQSWDKLAVKQSEALAWGLEFGASEAIKNAPFDVVVTLDPADMYGSLVKLKAVMNKLRVQGSRRLFAGSDIESAILLDERITLAQNVGDEIAAAALREAVLGRVAGFNIVSANELGADDGVAAVESAFVMITGAPLVPRSVKHGASAKAGNVAVRWITDYDMDYQLDRSLFTLYKGFRHVDDVLVGHDEVTGQQFISTGEHFVRAVKLELGASAGSFAVELSNTELENITGLTSTDGTSDGA